MKLVYISNSKIPSKAANSIHVMKMCQAFKRQGVDITCIGLKGDILKNKVNFKDYVKKHYGLEEDINIKIMSRPKIFGGYIYAIKIFFYMIQEISNVEFVFSRGITNAIFGILLKKKTMCETHSPFLTIKEKFCLRILKRSSNFHGLVLITNAQKNIMRSKINIIENIKTVVLPDGVDSSSLDNNLSIEEAKSRINIDSRNFVVGYSGHLYKGRGIELIIKMAQELDYMTFIIMGGRSSDVSYYQNLINELELDNIILYGFIHSDILFNYLISCDILLMPYQKEIAIADSNLNTVDWMSPMKMFEYMATQRAIISSDLPVLREILDEKNSMLVKSDDLLGWIKAIKYLNKYSDVGYRLSQKAYKKVLLYTWEKRAENILNCYNSKI